MNFEPSGSAPQQGARTVVDQETVVIRFCGDSGDGMQLTGTEFTKASALHGNDLSTLPDFPAEIRAPAGTLAGVSGFQINFSSHEVYTPGDQPDVLVAMNPAALRTNVADLAAGGTLIVNTGAFTPPNLDKAGYKTNPLEDGSLDRYKVYRIDVSKLTALALQDSGLSTKEVSRCKNFFALGLMFWLYNRDTEKEIKNIQEKFGKTPAIAEANIKVFKAGYHYGETAEIFTHSYQVRPATHVEPGVYRNITGNEAAAIGFVAAAQLSGLKLFLGSYPITPASDLLHQLSTYKNYGVCTFQAEDEIAAVSSAIGAAFGGHLALTTTSGPGLALKGEAMGLAMMTELPVVIVDVQRGGPSTGLPTKTEQADLLQAYYGRNGECPIPVIAASTPGDCFFTAIEACQIAVRYMTPVIMLTDGYLANGAEPWKLPEVKDLKRFDVKFRTNPENYKVYARNPETLARDWVKPGTPGLEHRVGGLEKDYLTGNVSYDPLNHEAMVRVRAAKVAGIAKELPLLEVHGDKTGDLLVIGWGGTYGAITQGVQQAQARGIKVSSVHLRHLNPFPRNLGEIIGNFKKVLVPELNLGQLVKIVRATFCVDAQGYNKIQGKPFKVSEIVQAIELTLAGKPLPFVPWDRHPGGAGAAESEVGG
ncbi:MAG TPA: 2-oxoacid:acceptor oxidoreductase subunit alpha [Polyangia bacterium]|nr:2-oxoacid:acceptor oxidoreductase subunit alpha [Polyangia bacterium]